MWFDSPGDPSDIFEQKENKKETLAWQIDRIDNSKVTDAMDSMAQTEIDAVKQWLSADELENTEYMSQFQEAKDGLIKTSNTILSGEWTPEEKANALGVIYTEFTAKIWSIRWTKEAQDGERSQKQAHNMEKDITKNTKASKDFQQKLLDTMKQTAEKQAELQRAKSQEQWQEARALWNEEARESQWEAPKELKEWWPV